MVKINQLRNHELKGYYPFLLLLLASIFYTGMGVCVKFIGDKLPSGEVLFFRFFICWVMLLPMASTIIKDIFKSKRWVLYIFRSFCGLLALWFLFISLRHLPLVDTILLASLAPLIIPFILYFKENKKIQRRLYLSIIIALIGVVLILNPDNKVFQLIALLPICASLFTALAKVSMKSLSKTESTKSIMFFYFSVGLVVPLFLTSHTWVIPKSLICATALFGVGVFGFFFQMFATHAVKLMPIDVLSPFLYLNIVFSFFADWLFWGQIPTIIVIIGIILVCASIGYLAFFKKKM